MARWLKWTWLETTIAGQHAPEFIPSYAGCNATARRVPHAEREDGA
jgi:hypothetical protein